MKKRILLILLVSVMLLGLFATAFVSCGDDEPEGPVTIPGITPDYPAPPIDEGAEDVGDDEEKLEAPEGGGAVGMIYTATVEVDLSDRAVSLYFINPTRSTHNVSVQVVVQDLVVAESGLLSPGKRVTALALKEGLDATIVPVGVYANNAKIVVRFYDPQTNTCSIVNSELLVTVTVRE